MKRTYRVPFRAIMLPKDVPRGIIRKYKPCVDVDGLSCMLVTYLYDFPGSEALPHSPRMGRPQELVPHTLFDAFYDKPALMTVSRFEQVYGRGAAQRETKKALNKRFVFRLT